jgi:peptidoglycan/LPS O-acetylase OafA/YrhL
MDEFGMTQSKVDHLAPPISPPTLAIADRKLYFDAARAIAALMVVMVHSQQFFNATNGRVGLVAEMGQLGVQLFFVISAFLIFDSLDRLRRHPKFLLEFYAHRFLRIAPLYYFAILANLLMWRVAGPALGISNDPDPNYTFVNVLANVLFLHGLLPSANQSIVGGGWSIGTECAFYFLAPALFMLRRKPLWLIFIGASCFPAMYEATGVLQPILGEPGYVNDNGFLYYSILNQLPVFTCGAVMFAWRDRLFRLSPAILIFCWIAPLGPLYYVWTRCPNGTVTFTLIPALAGMSSVFLITLLSKIDHFGWLIQEIGKRSFSMYLWNLPALLILKYLTGAVGFDLPFVVAFPVVATLAFLMSGITYYAIERPFMNIAKRLSQRTDRIGEPTP